VSKVLSDNGIANTHHLGTFRWMVTFFLLAFCRSLILFVFQAPEVMHSFGDYTCQVDGKCFYFLPKETYS